GRETIYLFNTGSDAPTDSVNSLYCSLYEPVELNEYKCRIKEVCATEAGVRLLFKEINPENTQPFYRLYWIPSEYYYLVEGLPIILECINEPDVFGTVEDLKSRTVLVGEVKSYKKTCRNEVKGKRKSFPVKLYSLCFSA